MPLLHRLADPPAHDLRDAAHHAAEPVVDRRVGGAGGIGAACGCGTVEQHRTGRDAPGGYDPADRLPRERRRGGKALQRAVPDLLRGGGRAAVPRVRLLQPRHRRQQHHAGLSFRPAGAGLHRYRAADAVCGGGGLRTKRQRQLFRLAGGLERDRYSA